MLRTSIDFARGPARPPSSLRFRNFQTKRPGRCRNVPELADALGTEVRNARRLVQRLAVEGYVVQDRGHRRRYHPTVKLAAIGCHLLETTPLRSMATPVLAALAGRSAPVISPGACVNCPSTKMIPGWPRRQVRSSRRCRWSQNPGRGVGTRRRPCARCPVLESAAAAF